MIWFPRQWSSFPKTKQEPVKRFTCMRSCRRQNQLDTSKQISSGDRGVGVLETRSDGYGVNLNLGKNLCGYLLPLSDEGTETGKDKVESARPGAWTTADGTRTDRQTDRPEDREEGWEDKGPQEWKRPHSLTLFTSPLQEDDVNRVKNNAALNHKTSPDLTGRLGLQDSPLFFFFVFTGTQELDGEGMSQQDDEKKEERERRTRERDKKKGDERRKKNIDRRELMKLKEEERKLRKDESHQRWWRKTRGSRLVFIFLPWRPRRPYGVWGRRSKWWT